MPETALGEGGGRRWWVFCVCFVFQSLFGFNLYAPTVYLVYYTEAFTVTVATAAWIASIFYFTNFMIGCVVSVCVERYGMRPTAMFGSSFLTLSFAASSWSPNIYCMFVLQGFCAGIGAGCVFIPMNVVVPRHFGRSRPFVSCLVICGLGVGMLVSPLAITHFVAEYGWRGAVLLHAGVIFHMLPLAMFFTEPRPSKEALSDVTEKLTGSEKETSETESQSGAKHRKSCAEFVANLCDVGLLRENPLFVLYSVACLCCRLTSTIVVTHLPRFFVTSGFSYDQAGVATSVSGGFNLLARFVATGVAATACVDLLSVYAALMFINGLAPVLLLWLPGYSGKVSAAAIFGFAFGFDYMFVPPIVVQLVGLERLAQGIALYNVISLAFIILAVPAFSGWLYDVTGSYALAFYLGAGCSVCGVALALIVSRLQARRRAQSPEQIHVKT